MDILRIKFSAYNKIENQFSQCFLLIQRIKFSITNVYEIVVSKNYFICSEIKVDILIKDKCKNQGGEFWEAYSHAENKGYLFIDFPDNGNLNMNSLLFPRIGEKDFEHIINLLGGNKITETQNRTPDFEVKNILLELKDLQKESLKDKNRQKSISKLFENEDNYSININPSLEFGELTNGYHRLIKNTIKNHFKSASGQIKQHQKIKKFKSSGIILLNTGLHSLPHKLLKKMVTDILNNETKTIEFAFILSQKTQTNGWNMNSFFESEWLGDQPHELNKLKSELDKLINHKLTEMIHKNNSTEIIEYQKPISFEMNNKVFYWNPGQLIFPWEEK